MDDKIGYSLADALQMQNIQLSRNCNELEFNEEIPKWTNENEMSNLREPPDGFWC